MSSTYDQIPGMLLTERGVSWPSGKLEHWCQQ